MNKLGDGVVEMGQLIVGVTSLVKAKQIHKETLERDLSHHSKEYGEAKKQHDLEILNLKQTHLLGMFNDMRRHFQQLDSDLLSSTKESERDMYDQRNQQCQTIIIGI